LCVHPLPVDFKKCDLAEEAVEAWSVKTVRESPLSYLFCFIAAV